MSKTAQTSVAGYEPSMKGLDFSVDQRAWDMAKEECGPRANFSQIASRAQELKKVMLHEVK